MAFRSNTYVQRYEFVRFQLDNVIIAPANNQHQQKMGISLRAMAGLRYTIGTMLISRCNSG